MVIISQNKNRIINFDNILEIWIDSNILDKTEPAFTINAETDSTAIKIGNYATEERAKEVLAEIVQKYSSYLQLTGGPAIMQGQMDIQPNIFNIPKVYEMPEN